MFWLISNSDGHNSYFNKAPPTPSHARVGSNASFHWGFTFGNQNDQSQFLELIWGTKLYDNDKNIHNKYLTITNVGEVRPNTKLSRSLINRLHWIGDIRKRGGTFVLSDVRLSDEKLYACELDLGLSTHNDPIVSVVRLIVTGMNVYWANFRTTSWPIVAAPYCILDIVGSRFATISIKC